MSQKATVSARHVGASHKKSVGHADFEPEIASLFSGVSETYSKTMLLTKKLQSYGYRRSSGEAFEVAVMLKNALRVLADSMLHLPS